MSTQPSQTDIDVLIVEDNPLDAMMIQRALQKAGFSKPPVVVDDGEPAIALLRRDAQYETYPVPSLVILDLNLKRIDGPEVLAFIRHTERLERLCVAIVSSSPTDVMFTRASEANCYFSKPSDLETFETIGAKILDCYDRGMMSKRE